MRTPVLFLIFNRPALTEQVIRAIAQARPQRLYIGSDGPRPNTADAPKVEECRRLVESMVNWPCEVRTLYRTTNLGCARAVSEAISWFFEHEEAGIILEDDCLPDSSFFAYCSELLNRYKENPSVLAMSGDNFHEEHLRHNTSYYFSAYFHCWGWATWRDRWQAFQKYPSKWADLFLSKTSKTNLHGSLYSNLYWTTIARLTKARKFDSWDYPFLFFSFSRNGLHIHPSVNLVQNLGFGADATHTSASSVSPKSCSLGFPLSHPPTVTPEMRADRLTEKLHFKITTRTLFSLQLKILRRITAPAIWPGLNG